jgi:predicted ATPase
MLTKLEIDGYRLLNDFSADLGALTVVIGANAVGKSTLLDFLQCISQCVEHPLRTVLGWHGGMVSLLNVSEKKDQKLSWHMTFKKPQSGVWTQLPLDVDRALLYEVVLQIDVQGQASAQCEALKASEPRPGFTGPFIYLEATPYRRRIYDRRYSQRSALIGSTRDARCAGMKPAPSATATSATAAPAKTDGSQPCSL